MFKHKTTYWWVSYDDYWAYWWWGAYTPSYDWWKIGSLYIDKEKIIDFKNKAKEKFRENYIPLNLSVNWSNTYMSKWNKFNINFSNSWFSKYNSDGWIEKLMDVYNKIPINANDIWSMYGSYYLNQNPNQTNAIFKDSFEYVKGNVYWWSSSDMLKDISDYFEWRITAEQLMWKIPEDIQKSLSKKISKEINEDWSMKSYSDIWIENKLCDYKLSDKFLKLIKSKIVIQDIVDTETSINKWKKLNKAYIEWRDWKPLKFKTVTKPKKKKILFLLDCSGSMSKADREDSPAYAAVSFLDAVLKSNIFNVTHIYYHSDNWYWDVKAKFLKKWAFWCYWWGEWFEIVDTNIPKEHVAQADYVVTLTDLCIWESAEKWLANFLSHSKKSLILSFKEEWTLQWLNVRTIPEDDRPKMINNLLTILS